MFRTGISSLASFSGRIPGYFTLCAGITLIGIGMSITRPYLSLYCTNVLHMTPAAVGAFLCVNGVGSIVASTWLARRSDTKTPRKDIMWVSALCSAVGYLVFLWIHTYLILLVITTVLIGIGMSTFPQMFAYAREAGSNSGDTTFAISTLRSFFSLAWVIGPLVGSWILLRLHYPGLFISTAIVYVFVSFLVVFRLKRKDPPGKAKFGNAGFLDDLRRPGVLLACIGFCAMFTASSMNAVYMPLFVTRSLHAPEHVVGWVVSLSAGLEIPIMIGLGSIADRVGKRLLLGIGTAAGIVYYALALNATHPWQMLALQIFCATLISIYMSIGMSYFQDLIPESPGAATTLYSNTNNFGSMTGSVLGGVIAQTFTFRSVYWTCAGLAILALVLLWWTGRAKKRDTAVAPI